MIGRTMSHLFLTVVAAAIFLVSGCVPIADPGEPVEAERIQKLESKVDEVVKAAEQVRAAEAERIQKLESKVDKAVKAADPDKTVKAADPDKILAYLGKDRDPKHTVKEHLQKRLKEVLCTYSVRFELDGVAWEKVRKDKEVTDPLSSFTLTKAKGARVYTKKELTLGEYESLRAAIGKYKDIDFAGTGDEGCKLLDGEAEVAYLSVTGDASTKTSQTFSFVLYLVMTDIPEDAEAWIVIPDDHWLRGIVKNEKSSGKLSSVVELLDAPGKKARAVYGSSRFYKIPPREKIQDRGSRTWGWKKVIKAEFSKNPYDAMRKALDNNKHAADVYAVITRDRTVSILGEKRTLTVALYRAFTLSASPSSKTITMIDKEISVTPPKNGVPSCFPLRETASVSPSFREKRVFQRIMEKGLEWNCQ